MVDGEHGGATAWTYGCRILVGIGWAGVEPYRYGDWDGRRWICRTLVQGRPASDHAGLGGVNRCPLGDFSEHEPIGFKVLTELFEYGGFFAIRFVSKGADYVVATLRLL